MILLIVLLTDTILAWIFVAFQIDYVVTWSFTSLTDKAMQLIIGLGITGVVICYAIVDNMRFISGVTDKIICVMSCLLLKPILLPVLFPGSFFKSPISQARPGKYVHVHEGITETKFIMTVQETNFIMTFTLAGVSAMTTFLAVAT